MEEIIEGFRQRFSTELELAITVEETENFPVMRDSSRRRTDECRHGVLLNGSALEGSKEALAVYTDISEEELGSFLDHYGIGELLSFKGIERRRRKHQLQ